MKRRSMQATIDELTEAFREDDPAPPVSIEERRALKAAAEREKVAAVQRARRADRQARDLSHRCCLCGVTVTGRPGRVSKQFAARWVGFAPGVGSLTLRHCKDCWRLVSKYENQGYLSVEVQVMYDRLEALDLLAYWPRENDGRDVNVCLPALSWAGWQRRHHLAGGEGEVGDPEHPFSFVLDAVPDPAALEWHPPVPA